MSEVYFGEKVEQRPGVRYKERDRVGLFRTFHTWRFLIDLVMQEPLEWQVFLITRPFICCTLQLHGAGGAELLI